MRFLTTVSITSLMLMAPCVSHAQEEHREVVLLPISAPPVDGAFGSRWVTTFRVSSSSTEPVSSDEITNLSICLFPPCSPFQIPPLATIEPPYVQSDPSGQSGTVLWATPLALEQLHFNLRVQDVSRASGNYGTEIPVVRESELRSGVFALPSVPFEEGFRSALRVYDAVRRDTDICPGFRLDLLDEAGAILFSSNYTLTRHGTSFCSRRAGLERPGTVEILRLEDLVPGYRGKVTVLITPDGVAPLWGFVSVTHNETQFVTLITPQ